MELTTKQKAAFGIGAVGKDMVYALSASYVMYYYQDVLGLPATFVGLILMIARVFDAFNDPFMGVLVAKTRTRWKFLKTALADMDSSVSSNSTRSKRPFAPLVVDRHGRSLTGLLLQQPGT